MGKHANAQLLTVEESYVERRQLFKDIWDTAMHIDEKDVAGAEILNKPKVIKTLRLDEVDRSAGKKKKQKIRNLRTVCNKILDFCDKQDADDMFYEQITVEGRVPPPSKTEQSKKATTKNKRKVKKSKSLFSPPKENTLTMITTSEAKKELYSSKKEDKTSRKTSPMKFEHTIIQKPLLPKKSNKVPGSLRMSALNPPKDTPIHNKVIKKKTSKRKKVSNDEPSRSSGTHNRIRYLDKAFHGRMNLEIPKTVLKIHKITI